MAEPQTQEASVQFLLSDFNTRLRDIEERNRLMKERLILLSQNFIESKQKSDDEIEEIKKNIFTIKKDVEKLKSTIQGIVEISDSYVKKQEVAVIERMLRDFQPLEFVREKDLIDLVKKEVLNQKKQEIKTTKSIKKSNVDT